MRATLTVLASILVFVALASAEPLPTPAIWNPCPVITKTVSATCTGIHECPFQSDCTQTVTATTKCGWAPPGPQCQPAATPTVTTTLDEGCTAPCGGICSHTATIMDCIFV